MQERKGHFTVFELVHLWLIKIEETSSHGPNFTFVICILIKGAWEINTLRNKMDIKQAYTSVN